MLHRRHTITIATSALIFLCLAVHAQTSATSQTALLSNVAKACKIYESILPADWTASVAHAKCLLIQAQTGNINFYPKSDPESAALLQSFHVLEKKDGIWKNLRWKGTSCGWAS